MIKIYVTTKEKLKDIAGDLVDEKMLGSVESDFISDKYYVETNEYSVDGIADRGISLIQVEPVNIREVINEVRLERAAGATTPSQSKGDNHTTSIINNDDELPSQSHELEEDVSHLNDTKIEFDISGVNETTNEFI